MPQELLYTSAPQGLDPGTQGFCTVQRSRGMEKRVQQVLESMSGFDPAVGGGAPVLMASRLPGSLGGGVVLTRMASSGRDYSGRGNKLVHHVVLAPNERPACGPACLLNSPLMKTQWDGTVRELPPTRIPAMGPPAAGCHTWKQHTGDAGHAGLFLQQAMNGRGAAVWVIVPSQAGRMILLEEATAVLPTAQRWQLTFATEAASLPGNVTCRCRMIDASSAVAKDLKRRSAPGVIDLSKPVPLTAADASLEFVRAARGESSGGVSTSKPSVTVVSGRPGGGRQVVPDARVSVVGGDDDSDLYRMAMTESIRPGSGSAPANPNPSEQPARRAGSPEPTIRDRPVLHSAPRTSPRIGLRIAWLVSSVVGVLLLCAGGTYGVIRYQKHQAELLAEAERVQLLEEARKASRLAFIDEAATIRAMVDASKRIMASGHVERDAAPFQDPQDWLQTLTRQRDSIAAQRESLKAAPVGEWRAPLETAESETFITDRNSLIDDLDGVDRAAERLAADIQKLVQTEQVLSGIRSREEAARLDISAIQQWSQQVKTRAGIPEVFAERLDRLQHDIGLALAYQQPLTARTYTVAAADRSRMVLATIPLADVPAQSVVRLHFPGDCSAIRVSKGSTPGSGVAVLESADGGLHSVEVTLVWPDSSAAGNDAAEVQLTADTEDGFWDHPVSGFLVVEISGRLFQRVYRSEHPIRDEFREGGSTLGAEFLTAFDEVRLAHPIDGGGRVEFTAQRKKSGELAMVLSPGGRTIEVKGAIPTTQSGDVEELTQFIASAAALIEPFVQSLLAAESKMVAAARIVGGTLVLDTSVPTPSKVAASQLPGLVIEPLTSSEIAREDRIGEGDTLEKISALPVEFVSGSEMSLPVEEQLLEIHRNLTNRLRDILADQAASVPAAAFGSETPADQSIADDGETNDEKRKLFERQLAATWLLTSCFPRKRNELRAEENLPPGIQRLLEATPTIHNLRSPIMTEQALRSGKLQLRYVELSYAQSELRGLSKFEGDWFMNLTWRSGDSQ